MTPQTAHPERRLVARPRRAVALPRPRPAMSVAASRRLAARPSVAPVQGPVECECPYDCRIDHENA